MTGRVEGKILVSASLVLAVMLGLVFDSPASAQSYPTKPVTVIVSWSAGGGTDTQARLVNQYAEKYLKQPLVVVNRVGAAGEIGLTELAKSRPDGYTIGWSNTPPVLTIPIQRKASFALGDFAPLCGVVYDPGILAVRSGGKYDTLEKLIEAAKKQPGVITYGTSGIGSDDHIAMLAFQKEAGIKLVHVPFDGSASAVLALLGGHVELVASNEGDVISHVRAGKVKYLAAMNPKRLVSVPDVPTFQEKGFNVISASAGGISAPKGTPANILKTLEEALLKAISDPGFVKKAKELEAPLHVMDSKAYGEYLRSADAFYRGLWAKDPWLK